jgi:hypothetical protein
MEGWEPGNGPGYGWPLYERTWVKPSPNAPNLWMARCYAGTVMLEGTTLSEGRGTTRPLELFGAPDLEPGKLLGEMQQLAPQRLQGCRLRECWFEPTFHKHAGKLCAGVQIHAARAAGPRNPTRSATGNLASYRILLLPDHGSNQRTSRGCSSGAGAPRPDNRAVEPDSGCSEVHCIPIPSEKAPFREHIHPPVNCVAR